MANLEVVQYAWKVTGYYVSMISVSVINNPDKKIFVNNLVILSLINFNLFLLNTWKYVQPWKIFCQNIILVCLEFIYNKGTFPR